MKLYALDESPYCVPVRAAIYAKGLDIEVVPPPGGLKSEAYRAVSLTGMVPCLALDDGAPLPESTVILDYLEDRFPTPALKPAAPEARAREALIRRLAETELLNPTVELFHRMSIGDGEAAKPETLARFRRGLGLLEQLVAGEGFATGAQLTTADCMLGIALPGVAMWAAGLGAPDLLAEHPKVAGLFERLMGHPAVARAMGELQAAMADRDVPVS